MSDEEFINKLKSELSKNTKENVEEYSENEIDKVNLDSKIYSIVLKIVKLIKKK